MLSAGWCARWRSLATAVIGVACVAGSWAGSPPAQPTPAPILLAPGVYMLAGLDGDPDADNLGRVGNSGFIVGDSGVIAIDLGTSARHGKAILAAIASVTDKPVKLALITHTRQEFLFGAAAFRERGIPVRMQRKAAQLMATRCEGCLKTLRKLLGDDEMAGTAMFEPDQLFDDGHRLDLIGRPVTVIYRGHSSGPGDIAVLDERSGVLFAGGLVDVNHIPDIQDGRLPEWLDALAALSRDKVNIVVGGHGPATTAAGLTLTHRYLTQLETRVRELLQSDTPLSEVAAAAAMPEFEAWSHYDSTQRRNASILFVRMEYAYLFSKGASGAQP